ncbi:MAG: PilT/PilU family type 4a pilus ATPase [Candidatus Abyssobacteria bacterium SURF_5]|uniref:PilT/PilU family type 4a pilus ATPase n=1 Tax=Abyssobacteria bacterium (strain SURF_5) TaxID=2093360 RepID=A0A3A4NFT7_ABYX5|nr:MAG: PilT/PilU family type 4a pilus ATPase [Candidatus Abyssubacteria bacterium SURF_5]
MNLHALLHTVVGQCGSDIHFKAGNPPVIRYDGRLVRLDYSPLSRKDIDDVLHQILTEEELELFRERRDLDVSYAVSELSRFRVNICREMGSVRLVFRLIPFEIPAIRELKLPLVLEEICKTPRGLVLVTGPTGSGKSTTLAAMISHINANYPRHIVTIEDPIEFVHTDRQGMVTQRQVGIDTDSFVQSMRAVVRQDPDVIMLGEMRDAETVFSAMQAAETGHLVLSTLHTPDAIDTVNRITDFFPAEQHQQVRNQFSICLRAIVSQRLVPRKTGTGRIAAVEILIGTQLVKERIRIQADASQIISLMCEGRETYGMQTFDQHLYELWEAEEISEETALAYATSPKDLSLRLRGLI